MKASPSLVIFLTVFLDLVGFGIVLPMLPVFSWHFGAAGVLIGLITASYSVMQFICAPGWGQLSDRIGRRPVLLVSLAGSVVSYGLFGVGCGLTDSTWALTLLLASRIFAGICGANITVAQAYIADVTPPEKRSQRMGMIGMAFGLGFILGPALGGLGLRWFGHSGPGWLAAGLCAVNFVLACMALPESRKASEMPALGHRRPGWQQWMEVLRRPRIGWLVVVFFLATFCFACFETTLGLLVGKNFGLNPDRGKDAAKIGYLYAFCGLIGALVQGGAIGRLVKQMGEAKVIALSLVLVALGAGPLPLMPGWGTFLVVLTVLSLGASLTRPPLFGLLSMLTPAQDQGLTLGIAQSAGSLARIVGPVAATSLFVVDPVILFMAVSVISAATAVMTWRGLCRRVVTAV